MTPILTEQAERLGLICKERTTATSIPTGRIRFYTVDIFDSNGNLLHEGSTGALNFLKGYAAARLSTIEEIAKYMMKYAQGVRDANAKGNFTANKLAEEYEAIASEILSLKDKTK